MWMIYRNVTELLHWVFIPSELVGCEQQNGYGDKTRIVFEGVD